MRPRAKTGRVLSLFLTLLFPCLVGAAGGDPGLEPEVGRLAPTPPAAVKRVRLVSYNVHSGSDLPRLIEAIQEDPELKAADVFLLQEIESHAAEGASQARKLAEALRLNYVYAPARPTLDSGTHGLAILSRFPLADIEVLPLPQFNLHYNTRRRIALAATVRIGRARLRIYNLHLDTRLNSGDRLEQLRPVVEAARAQPLRPVVIGGDFNTNRFRWAFHVFPVIPSGQAGAVDEFMQSQGFAAPFAGAGATSRKAFVRLRLDALYPRGVTVNSIKVARAVEASDHAPVWMDVAWPPAAE